MRREDIRVCVLRIEGTNSEEETAEAFRALGAQAELVHVNQLDAAHVAAEDYRKLEDYQILMIPGGFSAGDYIRAGAIWAARLRAKHAKEIERFVVAGKPVGGICNGFQVLVELGLLPSTGHEILPKEPHAVLYRNDSAHYECRPVLLRHESRGTCAWTRAIRTGDVRTVIAAHGEGKLLFPTAKQEKILRDLAKHDQIVFRYTTPAGGDDVHYPWNPNGAPGNVAGITNREGTVFGMMPHPERVFHRWQHPDWTRRHEHGVAPDGPGDGRAVFESVLAHVERRF